MRSRRFSPGISRGTNALEDNTTLPSKFLRHFPILMYSSTAAQSWMNRSQPSNMHFVFLGGIGPADGAPEGRECPALIASTMVLVKSFKKDPSCSVLINPGPGDTLAGATTDTGFGAEAAESGRPSDPGTPCNTHFTALYTSVMGYGREGW